MKGRESLHREVETFFESMWQRGDPWELESSEYEQAKYARLLTLLTGRRYPRVLELGCGAGAFTRLLAPLADEVLALDVSSAAIARARTLGAGPAVVDFRQANIMDYDPHTEGPWDLVVISDTICYLGWLYSFFDVGWFATQLFTATCDRGRCLFANTLGEIGDMLLLPWLIRTYRDLFLNVGYCLETEAIFRGIKHGITIEVLMSLFVKPPAIARGDIWASPCR